ncbi:MAG TPA: response regulator [Acidimicrobiia bacterium]|jgi:DNA-binding response OmpR family regulator
MSTILVVADEPWVRNEVHAALTTPDFDLIDHSNPATVTAELDADPYDAVVVDLQVGSMGGMAITRSIRQRAAIDNEKATPVVVLLDRQADAFLAKRAGAAAWVVKPFTAHLLSTAVESAIAGNLVGQAAE